MTVAENVPITTLEFLKKLNKDKWITDDDSKSGKGHCWWVVGDDIRLLQMREGLIMRIFNVNATNDVLKLIKGLSETDVRYDGRDTSVKLHKNVDLDSLAENFIDIVYLTKYQ